MPCPRFPYLPLPPPLLVGLSAHEPSAFWQDGYGPPARRARQLFLTQPPGYIAATRALDELHAGHPRRAAAPLAPLAAGAPGPVPEQRTPS